MGLPIRSAMLSLLAPAVIWAVPAQAGDAKGDLWTGIYLGAQAGYQGIVVDPTICLKDASGSDCSGAQIDDVDLGGAEAGLYLGYNYNIDPVVIGFEADLNAGFANTSEKQEGYEFDVLAGGALALRARLGMLAGERTLIYATGGPSLVSEEVEITNCSDVYTDTTCDLDSETHFGWQVGGGVEYFATDRLSLKAEYLYGWYGEETLTVAEDDSSQLQTRNELNTNTIRLGVAYHFNGQ